MPWQLVQLHPPVWFVCFHRTSPTWWVQRLPLGRWKHVNCFGFIPGQKTWVFYDYALDGSQIAVVPDSQPSWVDAHMQHFMRDARVLEYATPADGRGFWQPIAVCVSEVSAMIGSKSRALRAGRFLRDLLREGATIYQREPDYDAGHESPPIGQSGDGERRGGERTDP